MRHPGQQLYAVIPAGGSGTRLWPLSRAERPKFLLPLTGSSDSLLQATVDRLAPLASPDTTLVVTGTGHAAGVARQLPALPVENILVEPSPRDSCPAIGLAAAIIARRDPDAIMGSFAADHLVRNREVFIETIRAAMVGAAQGRLMTVGITPTAPETGYGYLRCGPATGDGPVRAVEEFTEKPSAEAARTYVESGRYLWNAGIFVWRVGAFLAELRRQQPALHDGLVTIADAWDTDGAHDVVSEVWPTLPRISVDYAVMEGAAAAGLVATVPGDFGWHDVGDFGIVGDLLGTAHGAGNVVVEEPKSETGTAEVVFEDSSGVVVIPRSGRLIAALGVTDLIIVDTEDALLVCRRDRAQDVKRIVERLKQQGDDNLI
jgi:mannose-1-phosphate guanylyltransferase